MANHAYAKFAKPLSGDSVVLFCNFISDRDFGGALVFRLEDSNLVAESTIDNEYWANFAQSLELFLSNNNKTIELRHYFAGDNALGWASTWLHSALAGAFGASSFKDDGVGPMSFLLHTKKSGNSCFDRFRERPNGSFGKVLRLMYDAHKGWVKEYGSFAGVKNSRLSMKSPPRLAAIGDGFVAWARSNLDAASLPRADLARLAVTDSLSWIPEQWLEDTTISQCDSLYLHAVRNNNVSAQSLLLPLLKKAPTIETVQAILQKLPEFKYADTPPGVWDRAAWLREILPDNKISGAEQIYKTDINKKCSERIDQILATMQSLRLAISTASPAPL